MSVALMDETQPCALVSPDQSFAIGGQDLGFPNQLQTDFVLHIGNNHGSYLGVTIRFPRSEDEVASFFQNDMTKSDDLSITIRWPLDTFDIAGDRLGDAQLKTLVPAQQQANEFGLLQVEVRPDEKSLIDGIGFPFRGKTAKIHNFVNCDRKVYGRWGLRDIFRQRRFYILVRDTIKTSLARFFALAREQTYNEAPYGNVHHWDVHRYKKQMAPEHLKTFQSPARFWFNGLNDVSTVITQSIAQDNWWYARDIHELRKVELPFVFVKDCNKPAAETDRFWAVTCLSVQFLERFKRSAPGFTAPDTELSIAFRGPPAPNTYRDDGTPDKDDLSWPAKVLPITGPFDNERKSHRATENGGYFVLVVHRPRDPTSPAYKIRNHKVQTSPQPIQDEENIMEVFPYLFHTLEKDKRENVYLNFHDGRVLSRRRVNATNDLFKATKMARNALHNHGDRTVDEYSEKKDASRAILQEFFLGRGYRYPLSQWHKITNGDGDDTQPRLVSQKADPKPKFDFKYADMAVSRLAPWLQDPFREYIKLVSFRLIGICGAEAGVDGALVAATLVFLADTDTNRVHASASTHKAVRFYASRLHKIGAEAVRALQEDTKPDFPRHIPLVVRGYNIQKEIGSFIRLVTQGQIEWEMSKWSQELSPCEWLLKLVNYGELDLDPLDSPELFQIRQAFQDDEQYAGLRAFVARDIPLRKVRDFAAAGATPSGKTRCDGEDRHETAQEERDSRLRAEHWARELIKSLLESIVESADVVCTTTHMSRDAPYNTFRESAKAIVLADAGTMSKAESIVVWGPSFKPCAIGGEVDSKTRPFIHPFYKQGDRYANHFGPEAGISVLKHMMGSGNAMFVANDVWLRR